MADKFTSEWTYTPTGFFEELFGYDGDGYAVEVGNGRILATFSGVAYEQIERSSREIQADLIRLFLGAQLISNQQFKLSNHQTKQTSVDGSAIVFISAGIAGHASMGPVDFETKDTVGNVITNTKKERIDARKSFALLASKYGKDPVVGSLLKSYNAAINDPQKALAHLYDIRDALKVRFRKDALARNALGITKGQWSRLGDLANDAPLSQGRHRGLKVGQLRSATPEELDEARTIARFMIRAYFDYLDSLPSAEPTA